MLTFAVGAKVRIRTELLNELDEVAYVATIVEKGEDIVGNTIYKVQFGEDFYGDPEQWMEPNMLEIAVNA